MKPHTPNLEHEINTMPNYFKNHNSYEYGLSKSFPEKFVVSAVMKTNKYGETEKTYYKSRDKSKYNTKDNKETFNLFKNFKYLSFTLDEKFVKENSAVYFLEGEFSNNSRGPNAKSLIYTINEKHKTPNLYLVDLSSNNILITFEKDMLDYNDIQIGLDNIVKKGKKPKEYHSVKLPHKKDSLILLLNVPDKEILYSNIKSNEDNIKECLFDLYNKIEQTKLSTLYIPQKHFELFYYYNLLESVEDLFKLKNLYEANPTTLENQNQNHLGIYELYAFLNTPFLTTINKLNS